LAPFHDFLPQMGWRPTKRPAGSHEFPVAKTKQRANDAAVPWRGGDGDRTGIKRSCYGFFLLTAFFFTAGAL